MVEFNMTERKETLEPQQQEKSEAEIILEMLKRFQEDNQALKQKVELLEAQGKEKDAELDKAFTEIKQNEGALVKGIEAIAAKMQPSQVQTAAGAQGSTGGGGGMFENIMKIIDRALGGIGGGEGASIASDPYRIEMVKTLDKIQLMYARKFAADTAKAFGVVPEAEHIVVQP
jgi:hypothetical protein